MNQMVVDPANVTASFEESNLLRTLREKDAGHLRPFAEAIRLNAGTVLYEPGDIVRFAYFPCAAAVVSFVVLLQDGRTVEAGIVGREGAVGGIVSQGQLPAYCRAEVQIGGPFLRIETAAIERAKVQSPVLNHLFARYADCLLAQMFQSVACNAAHSIEQRTAKWLLAALDRTGGTEVLLTQEQMAGMLGVGRSYMSRVIHALKASGTLNTRRGKLMVNDAAGLRRLSCECNESLKRHFETVLRGVYPSEDDPALEKGSAGR